VSIPEPRSRRQSRREREQANRRRDAIEGAAAVFAAKGFHDAQMTEIAAAAELSLASLYSMFHGKDDLFREVLRTATGRMREFVQRAVEPVEDPAEALLEVIDALFDCFDDMRDLTRMVMSSTQGVPWRFRQQMGGERLEAAASFMSWVVGLAKDAQAKGYLEGIDPEVFARTLVGAVANAAAMVVNHEPGRPFRSAAPQIRAIFTRVLQPPAGE
jgi:AcrR family transcriptional regulator